MPVFVAVSLALSLCVPVHVCDHALVRVPDRVGLSVRVCSLCRVSVRVHVSGSVGVRGVSVAVFLFVTVSVGGRVRVRVRVRIRIPGRVRGRVGV